MTKACRVEAPGVLSVARARPAPHTIRGPGLIEQDPRILLEGVIDATAEVARASGSPVTACGLANQGETFLLYERRTGEPFTPAISWQDTRSQRTVERLEAEGLGGEIKARTGLELHTEFPATKLSDLLSRPDVREAARSGRVAFGTLDTWLLNRLCGEQPHVTDHSTAARTMLYNLDEGRWDSWLCELFGIPIEILPEIHASDDPFGTFVINGNEVPFCASAVDTGAALFGQCCFAPGDAKNSFGTCSALWVNTGEVASRTPGLLDTVAWSRGSERTFAVDGEVLAAGSVVTWLIKNLGLASQPAEIERLAMESNHESTVIFVPALGGLGAPHWDSGVTAAFLGMRAETTKAELARAALESIAFSLSDALEAARQAGHEIDELRVDGGLTNSSTLMQTCADAIGCPVLIADVREATAYGVASLAALKSGVFGSLDELRNAWKARKRYEPRWTLEHRVALTSRWRSAVAATRRTSVARLEADSTVASTGDGAAI